MGRYRPPTKPGAKYITPEGFRQLKEEHDYLWRKKRPAVTKALSEAAAEGDRSENAEYIYRKKELREIDRRVRYLQKRLDDIQVVDRLPADQSKVFFGAWVTVADEEGEESRYRLVGPDEIDLEKGYISVDSPLAQALLKKAVGDEVVAKLPKGEAIYYVESISYEAPNADE